MHTSFYLWPPPFHIYLLTEYEQSAENAAAHWQPQEPDEVSTFLECWQQTLGNSIDGDENRGLELFTQHHPFQDDLMYFYRPAPYFVPVVPVEAEKPQIRQVSGDGQHIDDATIPNIKQYAWQANIANDKEGLPPHINVGFAELHQGYDTRNQSAYLMILGQDCPLTDDGLGEMMAFMDVFVHSSLAAKGFTMTYDLRNLRTPSMNMVTRVAGWGSEPQRQEIWERLNTACKVVVNAGLRFKLCQGLLSTFFYVCPPVCRTYLLTDPFECEETAVAFDPPCRASS